MPRSAVFLDRDGVLNISHVVYGKPFAPKALNDFIFVKGAGAALARLKEAGYLLIVITNQPDVGNGLVSREIVEAMNAKLQETLPVDDIEVCYASQKDGSPRRKPEPGMIFDASGKWEIDLPSSFVIGDRWSDVEAGSRAGCKTIFIDNGYAEQKPLHPDFQAVSLDEAVDILLENAAPVLR